MSNVKWIKLSTNMFEDEKIRLIEQMPEADTILVIWVKLLSQAGKTNASGYIYLSENIPYTDEMLATIFNRPLSTVRLALETFKQFGMIEIDDDSFLSIANWEKHQNVDALEKIREDTRKRVAKHRLKQKEKKEQKKLHVTEEKENKPHNNKDDVTCNVTVTESNETEEELELEEELDIDKESTLRSKLKFETHHLQLAELLFKEIKINMPNHKKPSLENWANTFRLMMERDKRAGKEIQDLILWCQGHDFWYKNILSPNKLRKQFDRLQADMQDDKGVSLKGGTSSDEGDYVDSVGHHGIKLYK